MATPAQPTQRTPLLPVNGETDALPTSNGAIVGWTPRVHQACPTCNGKGKIPKDAFSRNELVTLISVNDKRLKPRRTFVDILHTQPQTHILHTWCIRT
eukprot:m.181294 g.181294  ORF g.181294 m.181294 type:complete len:98 (-) comp14662_c1_seq21:238-531(-)